VIAKNSGSKRRHRCFPSPKPTVLFSEIMAQVTAVVPDVPTIRAQVTPVFAQITLVLANVTAFAARRFVVSVSKILADIAAVRA